MEKTTQFPNEIDEKIKFHFLIDFSILENTRETDSYETKERC